MGDCKALSHDDVQALHDTSARPQREGDEVFRIPWELRSFALGVAYYETKDFAWSQFQGRLVAAIDAAEQADRPEHYYARWVEALEALLNEHVGLDADELERRTQQILSTPRDDTHQHAHHEPVSVADGDAHISPQRDTNSREEIHVHL
jgi:nitrile hydratase accessory protein